MRFVLVNGRTPRPQSFCAMCCEPIGNGYLREIATRLSYCDRNCYLGRSTLSARAVQLHSPGRYERPQHSLPIAPIRLDSCTT
jgi:hypothetical protein